MERMQTLFIASIIGSMVLAGCLSFSSSQPDNPPDHTTVVVPPNTTVVCPNGSNPPCP
jgi:hypothetical protein